MTSPSLLRTLLSSRLLASKTSNAVTNAAKAASSPVARIGCASPQSCMRDCRCFAQVHDIDKLNRDVWFNSSIPRSLPNLPGSDHKPPDERTLKLGKTVRTLHDQLPTLLQSPLPSELLSPQITLHLFPSTHPHLPTVSGRIAYVAALWTAPVAWGRIPLVGNVKLTILSERMVRNGDSSTPSASRDEKLIVKWKTCGKTKHRDGTGGIYRGVGISSADPVEKIRGFINGARSNEVAQNTTGSGLDPEEFCGIFIFEFDDQGRIVKHTIEHTEEGGHWDKMARVVSVTDWLLGKVNGRNKEEIPALAWCEERPDGFRVRIVDRRRRHDL